MLGRESLITGEGHAIFSAQPIIELPVAAPHAAANMLISRAAANLLRLRTPSHQPGAPSPLSPDHRRT